jgi:hypothetical protein
MSTTLRMRVRGTPSYCHNLIPLPVPPSFIGSEKVPNEQIMTDGCGFANSQTFCFMECIERFSEAENYKNAIKR